LNILKSLKFIFFRLSGFLFDMIVLSFVMAIALTVLFDVLGTQVKALDVIYNLSMSNSIFKSLVYLIIIGVYYGIHVYFRWATLGLWITHQDFAEKLPEISKEKSKDLDMLEEVSSNKVKRFFNRIFVAFLYSSFQMINIALLGVLTLIAGFKDVKIPYHEGVSGVHIISRKK
jgi:hypothetical protein